MAAFHATMSPMVRGPRVMGGMSKPTSTSSKVRRSPPVRFSALKAFSSSATSASEHLWIGRSNITASPTWVAMIMVAVAVPTSLSSWSR